jgi:hypothetical protein
VFYFNFRNEQYLVLKCRNDKKNKNPKILF